MLDRLETELLTIAKAGTPVGEGMLGQKIGVTAEELGAVLTGLGYLRAVAEDGAVTWRRRPQGPRPPGSRSRREKPANADHPFAKLRQLSGI